ncbi:tRNA lysidine(34) synthetase TilS [Erwinia sp. P7711]|uniref:tRNA lysidine(34) synthetase TilS n=1 Tax=Erwinia sp. P7711 TaxID=3141451 RepID=UPI003195371F
MPLHSLAHHLHGHQQLLVGYSGGLDSTVLLHQLVKLREQRPELHIRAIHIHHGLNPLADSWVEHCQQQCSRWQVELVVARVTLAPKGKGIEAAARAARYQAFTQHLRPAECLLTAQHQDDQCETLLLALKRGSGPAGLSGMAAESFSPGQRLLRPLLSLTRQQLEAWAAEHALSWIEDDSNQDTRFDRNFLRQTVIPQLVSRWPHFSQAAARSAALCAEQEQLLDELLADSLRELVDSENGLAWPPLLAMSEARRAALIRRWIALQHGLMPSREALVRIWQEVACSREDAEPCVRLGQFEVRRFRDRLYWLAVNQPVAGLVLPWPQEEKTLALPQNLGWLQWNKEGMKVRAPFKDEEVSVRFQAQGKFHLTDRAGSRSLKKIWQEKGVPPWQRDRTPLLFYGDRLIAAAGVFVTREGDPENYSCWHLSWNKEQQ